MPVGKPWLGVLPLGGQLYPPLPPGAQSRAPQPCGCPGAERSLTPLGPCVQNVTSTVVRTTLRNDLSPEGIIHHMKILSPIHCAFRNDLLTSSGYTPEWG